jgi:hypothetical protein
MDVIVKDFVENNFAGGRWSHLTSLINWKNCCNAIPATIYSPYYS